MTVLEIAPACSRRLGSSTCSGPSFGRRTSDRAARRPPHPRRPWAWRSSSPRRSSAGTSPASWRASGRSLSPSSGRSSGRSTAWAAIDETAEQGWKGYAVSVLVMAVVGHRRGLSSSSGSRTSCPSTRAASPAMSRRTSRSTRRSASRRTRTGRTTPARPASRYLTQMLVLAVRNFTSAATGLAVAIALFRGLTRRSAADDRQLLGRPDPRRPLHPAADRRSSARSSSSGRASRRRGTRRQRPSPRSRARPSTSRSGRSRPRNAIKELGNNGGGFLNANSAHPFENPTPLTNWLEMFAILALPFALTYTFGRYAGDQRQGWTIFGAMAIILLVGAVVAMHVESAGNPLFPAGVDQAGSGTWKARRRASGPPSVGLFMRRHDRHQHGRDQRLARQRPADRRARPALQHGARRDHARRDRRRHVRHARHRRDPGGLHRRPDGRPDAGVPRQEGRGLRDQDGDAHVLVLGASILGFTALASV